MVHDHEKLYRVLAIKYSLPYGMFITGHFLHFSSPHTRIKIWAPISTFDSPLSLEARCGQ